MHVMDIFGPVIVALVYISLCSLFKVPNKRSCNATFIAGAGAAYLSGGFGVWEFVFLAVFTYCAYRGLRSYYSIGVGWLLHTGWDVLHHLYGNLIVPSLPDSSFGCAITDPVIARRCFAGAPSVYALFRGKGQGHQASGDTATQPGIRP
jgi:hypothetical protein